MLGKIDAYITDKTGRRLSAQIKVRDENSGPDIIYDAYEPFYGFEHPDTQIGRDARSRCQLYIVQHKNKVHLVSGTELRKVVNFVIERFKKDFTLVNRKYTVAEYPGVELKVTRDHKNDRVKVMVFVPPTVFGPKHAKTATI